MSSDAVVNDTDPTILQRMQVVGEGCSNIFTLVMPILIPPIGCSWIFYLLCHYGTKWIPSSTPFPSQKNVG